MAEGEDAAFGANKRKLKGEQQHVEFLDTSSYTRQSIGDNDLVLPAAQPSTIEKFSKVRPTMEESREALARLTGEGSLSLAEERANTAHIKALQKERAIRLRGGKVGSKKGKKSKKEKKKKDKEKKKKKKKKQSKRKRSDSSDGSDSSGSSSDSSSDDDDRGRDRERSSSKKHKKHKKHKSER